jgi:hypothetical protein
MTIQLVKEEDCSRTFKRNTVNNKLSTNIQQIQLIPIEDCSTPANKRLEKMTPHERASELKRSNIIPKEYKKYSCKFYKRNQSICTEHEHIKCSSCIDFESKYSK